MIVDIPTTHRTHNKDPNQALNIMTNIHTLNDIVSNIELALRVLITWGR
jgi:hypothetical protein